MNAWTEQDRAAAASDRTYDYLSILARAKAALDAAREVSVDVAEIRRYKDQPRTFFNPDGIQRLADSIDAGGQVTSGLIREKPAETRYELIDGERRWRAVSAIPKERRPLYKAKLIVADDDVIQFLISGIANFNREGHTSLETMETIDRLLTFGLPMEQIAAVLGISTMWAYQIHGLKKLTPAVRDLLDPTLPKNKQLPITAAIQISKIDPSLQAGLASRVLNRDVSLARLRTEVVRVATRAGMPVRVREVDPRKKLASAMRKAGVLSRAASDLQATFDNQELRQYILAREPEVKRIQRELNQAQTVIRACVRLLSTEGNSP